MSKLHFLSVLPPRTQRTVAQMLTVTTMPANTVLVEHMEEGADRMYMIYAGSCACFERSELIADVMVKVGEVQQFDHFGHDALVSSDTVWPSAVETKEETILVMLSRDDFDRTCRAEFEMAMAAKIHAMRRMPLFHLETTCSLMALSYAASICDFEIHDVVVQEGRRPPRMHTLVSGEISVTLTLPVVEEVEGEVSGAGGEGRRRRRRSQKVLVAKLGPGMVFGAESVCVALDAQRTIMPKEATSVFTYEVSSQTATTIAFSSERFVQQQHKSGARETLEWLQAYQRGQVPVAAVRKEVDRAGRWRAFRDRSTEEARQVP